LEKPGLVAGVHHGTEIAVLVILVFIVIVILGGKGVLDTA
jgi:hypothetical protein